MSLYNYTGAPSAPALPDFAASLAAIPGLRAVYAANGPGVTLDGSGRVSSVAPIAQAAGGSRNFGGGANGPTITKRQGLNCLSLQNAWLDGPAVDFGANTVLTLFCILNIPTATTGVGNVFGDFSGTRFGIELGGIDGNSGLPRLRCRSTAQIDIVTRPGWHTCAYELSGGQGFAQFDQGARMATGAAAVDGNAFSLGNSASAANDAAILAWGYALSPLITNGTIAPFYAFADYLLGARRIGV